MSLQPTAAQPARTDLHSSGEPVGPFGGHTEQRDQRRQQDNGRQQDHGRHQDHVHHQNPGHHHDRDHAYQDLPFEIQTLDQYVQHNTGDMPHRHQHVEIVWVRQGEGFLNIDLKRYKVSGNTLYCIVPGQLHQLEIERGEGYIISFPEGLLSGGSDDFELLYRSGLFHLLLDSPGIRVTPEVAEEFEEIGKRLYRELCNGYLLRSEIIKRYISIFLIHLARQFEGSLQVSVQTRNMSLMKSFISLIEKKYMYWKLVKDYACELSVTPNYLNEVVKKVSGYPAGYHIRQRIVLEAKRQAATAGTSMKEIAYHLGFDDIAHFSKFFKSVCGKNFSDFRKERFTHCN